MGWTVIVVMALVGIFFMWRSSKNAEKAKVASAQLDKDTKLYRNIKTGMREYNFREVEGSFGRRRMASCCSRLPT